MYIHVRSTVTTTNDWNHQDNDDDDGDGDGDGDGGNDKNKIKTVSIRKTALTHYLRYWSATASPALSPDSQSHFARNGLRLNLNRTESAWLDLA